MLRLIGTRTRSIQRTLREVQSLPSDFASGLIKSEEDSEAMYEEQGWQTVESVFDGEDLL